MVIAVWKFEGNGKTNGNIKVSEFRVYPTLIYIHFSLGLCVRYIKNNQLWNVNRIENLTN